MGCGTAGETRELGQWRKVRANIAGGSRVLVLTRSTGRPPHWPAHTNVALHPGGMLTVGIFSYQSRDIALGVALEKLHQVEVRKVYIKSG